MTTQAETLADASARSPESIRSFRYHASDAELGDLRRRIAATRFPERELAEEAAPSVTLATLEALARYWATEYDWRAVESKLDSYPQFMTEIDGLDIHFLHVRSRHAGALPIVVTHGWPGSIVEQLKIVDLLVDPTAHGGSAADAFHVVIPSRPGCGFSGKPTSAGWDCPRIARAWNTLMKRLGYTRYVAQGGDWGAFVTEQMGAQSPAGLLGIHTNLPCALPAEIARGLAAGEPPAGLSAEESRAFESLAAFLGRGLSYAQQMALRPRALYGVGDSPVGLAAWYLDNELWSAELLARAFEGQCSGLTRDDLLDNITFTWLTNTAISSMGLYRENRLAFFAPMGVGVPAAVSVFPGEIYRAPRSWVERAYPRLIHYNQVERGGHFAAWEQPQLFVDEVRAGLRSLR